MKLLANPNRLLDESFPTQLRSFKDIELRYPYACAERVNKEPSYSIDNAISYN